MAKIIFYITMSLICFILIGIYIFNTVNGYSVEVYRWIITSFFALFFTLGSIDEIKNRKKNK